MQCLEQRSSQSSFSNRHTAKRVSPSALSVVCLNRIHAAPGRSPAAVPSFAFLSSARRQRLLGMWYLTSPRSLSRRALMPLSGTGARNLRRAFHQGIPILFGSRTPWICRGLVSAKPPSYCVLGRRDLPPQPSPAGPVHHPGRSVRCDAHSGMHLAVLPAPSRDTIRDVRDTLQSNHLAVPCTPLLLDCPLSAHRQAGPAFL